MTRHLVHSRSTLQMVVLSVPSSDVEWVPNTDIYENETAFVVRMEVAGINLEDLQITLSDHHLTVRGRRPDPHRTNQCRFRQMEIEHGTFERRLILPKSVDNHRTRVHYRNGFLMIELPKSASAEHSVVRLTVEQE